MKLLGIIIVGFNVTDQLQIKEKGEYNVTVHQLFIDSKKTSDSVKGGSTVICSHTILGTHETIQTV
jgi:hypothetical protein